MLKRSWWTAVFKVEDDLRLHAGSEAGKRSQKWLKATTCCDHSNLLHSHKGENDIWMKTHNHLLIHPQNPVHHSRSASAGICGSILSVWSYNILSQQCGDPRRAFFSRFPSSLFFQREHLPDRIHIFLFKVFMGFML